MEQYSCYTTNRFKRSFRKLPTEVRERVIAAVGDLIDNPCLGHFITSMGVWSYRLGDYRILYQVNEEKREIVLLTVKHRRSVYR